MRRIALTTTLLLAAPILSGCATVEPINAEQACRAWERVWGPEDFENVREPFQYRLPGDLEQMAEDWQEAAETAKELSEAVRADDSELADSFALFAERAEPAIDGARVRAGIGDPGEVPGEQARRELIPAAEAVTIPCLILDIESGDYLED